MNNTAVINNEAIYENEFEAQDVTTEAGKAQLSLADKILAVRYFLPLCSSVGLLIMMLFSAFSVMVGIATALIVIGFISAFTVCPLKLLGFPLKCMAVGFKVCRGFIPVYGVADLCAAIFGVFGGAMFGIAVVTLLPAIFTIKKFFAE